MNERQFSNTVDATKETLICHPSKQVNIKKTKGSTTTTTTTTHTNLQKIDKRRDTQKEKNEDLQFSRVYDRSS